MNSNRYFTEQQANEALSLQQVRDFAPAPNPSPINFAANHHLQSEIGALTLAPDGPYATGQRLSEENFYYGPEAVQPDGAVGTGLKVAFLVAFVVAGLAFIIPNFKVSGKL